jgi:hypothetical protein
MLSVRTLATVACVLLLSAAFQRAADATTTTSLVTVQPIEVCADDGSGCATPDIASFETAANKIFSQTGLGLVFLPVSQLRDSSYQTTIVDPSGNPIDQAHQLLRLPNAAQSPNPTTLDVYFVASLQRTDSVPIFGYGLINSNGAIVGGGAAVDTMAHELGHNLGLLHTDLLNSDGSESAGAQVNNNNLMQSLFRMVPTSASDTRIGSTIDLLTSGQGTQVQNPLFTAGLLDVTVGRPGPGWCTSLVAGCIFGISASSAGGAPGESLTGMKLRFLHASDLADFDSTAMSINCSVSSSALPLSGGGVELDYAFPTGCIAAGDHSHFSLDYPEDPSATCGLCGRPTLYTPPFSVEFDYATGFTSTALYDATGDDFVASNPVELGFVGTPTYGLGVTVPFDPTEFDVDSHAAPVSVAEPGSAMLLLAGIAGLILGLRSIASARLNAV